MTLLGALISFRFLTFLKVEVNLSDFFCSLGRVDQECVLRMAPREARHKSIGRAGTGKDNNTPGCVMPSQEDWRKQPNLAALSCWLRRGYPGTALAPASASDTCGGET